MYYFDYFQTHAHGLGNRLKGYSLTLRWSKLDEEYVSGYCSYSEYKILLTIRLRTTAAEIKMVLLHELVHILVRGEVHGPRYKQTFADISREYFGLSNSFAWGGESAYDLGIKIAKAIEE